MQSFFPHAVAKIKEAAAATTTVRTHHRGLVLVDHHFFSFRNYHGARDKTESSKAAEIESVQV